MAKSLEQLRHEIDQLDDQIVRLLNQRASLAVEIGEIKHSNGSALYVPAREREVLKRLMAENSGPLSDRSICRIYAEVMASALALEHHSHVVAGGAPDNELIDAVQFLAGGNAEVKCLASAAHLAKAFAGDKKSMLVVTDVWSGDVIQALKHNSVDSIWRGCWILPATGTRYHLFAHSDLEADLSRPAVFFCLINLEELEGPVPPAWLGMIPATSFEYYPVLTNNRQGILKLKMELNVRDARVLWFETLQKHSSSVWII